MKKKRRDWVKEQEKARDRRMETYARYLSRTGKLYGKITGEFTFYVG